METELHSIDQTIYYLYLSVNYVFHIHTHREIRIRRRKKRKRERVRQRVTKSELYTNEIVKTVILKARKVIEWNGFYML